MDERISWTEQQQNEKGTEINVRFEALIANTCTKISGHSVATSALMLDTVQGSELFVVEPQSGS